MRLRPLDLIFIATILASTASAEEITYRAIPIHYDIEAELTPAGGRVEASARIKMRVCEDGITEITLGFDAALSATGVSDGDGQALQFGERRGRFPRCSTT